MKLSWASLRLADAARWVPWAALLPIPLWFSSTLVLAPEPVWIASYFAAPGKAPAAVVRERELTHVWYGEYFEPAPGDVAPDSFTATFETCLMLDADVNLPIMLLADGSARLLVDGESQLSLVSAGKQRGVEGKTLGLARGRHRLRVEFSAQKRPSVGLLASFDGSPPRAVGSGAVGPGATTFPPSGDEPACGP